MQPRTLEQILNELNTTGGYDARMANVKAQQALIPQNTESSIAEANAAQTKAYEDIITGARHRGLGFSGIPLGEQAKYSSTVYAPAILATKERARTQALSLEDTLNQLISDRYAKALGISQWEQQMAENQRQFNANLAAQSAATAAQNKYNEILANSLNKATTTGNTAQGSYTWSQDKGYQFFDPTGKPISATAYHQGIYPSTQQDFRTFLQELDTAHPDSNIHLALQFVGNDYNLNPTDTRLLTQAGMNRLNQLGLSTPQGWAPNSWVNPYGSTTKTTTTPYVNTYRQNWSPTSANNVYL